MPSLFYCHLNNFVFVIYLTNQPIGYLNINNLIYIYVVKNWDSPAFVPRHSLISNVIDL